jgi:hypothetical protein
MTKAEIVAICDLLGILYYKVNDDGIVDAEGNVDLRNMNLTEIPVQFGCVNGDFDISGNNLKSLLGSPHTVGGDFNCAHNELRSLVSGPSIVGESYNCANNLLSNLEGAPRSVGRDFACFLNDLASLEGGPEEVVGDFYVYDSLIKCLTGSPRIVGGSFRVSGNNLLEDLRGCPITIGGDLHFDHSIISTYSGDKDCRVSGNVKINTLQQIIPCRLPAILMKNQIHLKYILKYQQYFEIWNDDLTFNEENFAIIIEECEDGLM